MCVCEEEKPTHAKTREIDQIVNITLIAEKQ